MQLLPIDGSGPGRPTIGIRRTPLSSGARTMHNAIAELSTPRNSGFDMEEVCPHVQSDRFEARCAQ